MCNVGYVSADAVPVSSLDTLLSCKNMSPTYFGIDSDIHNWIFIV